ncbi:hypothetical protein AMECASPLE_034683 [Ameca splendens]|uniref:Uncharacterized protein n=1 Tax=Ameca splendens TaxID=208324 RepID=A0ABV0ZS45_9TELE
MTTKNNWLYVIDIFKNSPLVINSCLGLIQICLEKIVEVEFACPCDSSWNKEYALLVFIVPPIIFLLLSSAICHCKSSKSSCKGLSNSLVPAMMWLIIVFIDGRYYACLMTNWSGSYEMINNAAPQKWCKPEYSSEESLAKTRRWYSRSQYTGFWMGLGLTLFYLMCLLCWWCSSSSQPKKDDQGTLGMIPISDVNETVRIELN